MRVASTVGMKVSDVEKIKAWIDLQLRESWAKAECLGHEDRSGHLYFPIRSEHGDLWLIIGHRARHGLAYDELTDFLNEIRWLDRLRTAKCCRVQMSGLWPEMVRPPELLL
jgi:hypothetical protein